MKIRFMFQDQDLGTAEVDAGSSVVFCKGDTSKRRIDRFVRMSGKKGEELLRYILDNSKGRNWAYEIDESIEKEEGVFPEIAKPQRGDEIKREVIPDEEKDDYGRQKGNWKS